MEKQDFVDVETFFCLYRFLVENFWFSPIFSGKTGLCGRGDLFLSLSIFSGKTGIRGREDLFFGLHRFLVVSQ